MSNCSRDFYEQEINPFVEKRLLAKILGVYWQDLILTQPKLTSKQSRQLQNYLAKVRSGYPVDYLLGEVNFLKQKFVLRPGVLVPRPETEFWVSRLKAIEKENLACLNNNSLLFETNKYKKSENKFRILVDIGCGSGVIGLSLAEYFNLVILVDKSQTALKNCLENVDLLGYTNVQVVWGDLLSEIINLFKRLNLKSKEELFREELQTIKTKKLVRQIHKSLLADLSIKLNTKEKSNYLNYSNTVDSLFLPLQKDSNKIQLEWILVANLPYLPRQDKELALKNKIYFEPSRALYAGKDGLSLFKKLIRQLLSVYQEDGLLPSKAYFELDPRNIRLAEKYLLRVFTKTQKAKLNFKQNLKTSNRSDKKKNSKQQTQKQEILKTEIWQDETGLERVLVVDFANIKDYTKDYKFQR